MSRHSALLALSLLFASAAALAVPNPAATEKKARSECRTIIRDWDVDLPASVCNNPQSRVIAMRRAYEMCEKERLSDRSTQATALHGGYPVKLRRQWLAPDVGEALRAFASPASPL